MLPCNGFALVAKQQAACPRRAPLSIFLGLRIISLVFQLPAPTYHARGNDASRGDLQRPSLGNCPGLHGRARRVCYWKRSGRGESHERVPSLRRDAAIEADGQRDGGEQRGYHEFLGMVSSEEKKTCGVSAALPKDAGTWVKFRQR